MLASITDYQRYTNSLTSFSISVLKVSREFHIFLMIVMRGVSDLKQVNTHKHTHRSLITMLNDSVALSIMSVLFQTIFIHLID